MKALDFIKSLKAAPAYLQVEAQAEGGCLSQCPSCAPFPSIGLSLAFNQIGEDLVVRCYGGCSDADLVNGLYFPSDGVSVLTANQWINRERERGHDSNYLQEKLAKALPLPEPLRPIQSATEPKARTFAEFMALQPSPRESLCGQWFRTGALVMVSGDSGAGKTWFCLDLALSVSTGVDFMGRWSVPKLVMCWWFPEKMTSKTYKNG